MILVLMHSWLRWMDDQEWLGGQEAAGRAALSLSIEAEHCCWRATSLCVVTHSVSHTLTFFSTFCNNLHIHVLSYVGPQRAA